MLEESRFKLKSVDTDLSQSSSKIQELINKKYLVEIRSREKQLSEELEDVLLQLDSVSVNDNKIEKLEKIYALLSKKLQELRTFISSSEIIVKEKKLRLVEIKNKLKQFSESEKEIKTIGKKADFLSKLKNAIIDAQGILRDDLILAVNEIMSSVWLEIYPYEAWSGLRLSTDSNDYTLQLKDPESDWINVNGYASGGERMLASLAAKIAFARVLAPTLNMLVLDEPTHNLDEKAVKNFIEVLHEKVSEFIDQIFIITHDERLAESANKVIKLI